MKYATQRGSSKGKLTFTYLHLDFQMLFELL
ncbi:unnamed protein product [Acanthoscelides obtectus]|uniref:Uncharacterized protein n=1 Tax=Acanthoscelides obtectus TaxID=200917 RepID=A0A9P0PIL0_ACAOB|nr:unnamed protein product [Acanthoscelides obtectus]CAK1659815.1 hypothetical protein AOBTE_LOCUS21687 [Acanthoscelides obtectus]